MEPGDAGPARAGGVAAVGVRRQGRHGHGDETEAVQGREARGHGAHPRAGGAEGLRPDRIKTSTVREVERFGGDTARKVVDYAAVVYEPKGDTAVYTNPEPLVFVRKPVKVEYIDGDVAVLADGPPAGTAVVTVGTAELLGMEFGVGK